MLSRWGARQGGQTLEGVFSKAPFPEPLLRSILKPFLPLKPPARYPFKNPS